MNIEGNQYVITPEYTITPEVIGDEGSEVGEGAGVPLIGELMVASNLISSLELDMALEEQERLKAQSKKNYLLGEILLSLKKINLIQLQTLLLKQKYLTTRKAREDIIIG